MPGLPDIQIPDIPIPGLPGSDVPDVPAPPNAPTMTCEEFTDLDEATQKAVIRAILAEEGNRRAATAEIDGDDLAGAMCQFLPELHGQRGAVGLPTVSG